MDIIFNTSLICIRSGSSMNQAKEMLKEKRIRHLPVVTSDNRIIGMISRTDMTDIRKFGDLPVDLFASAPAVSVTIDTPLWTAALTMVEQKISSVILVDEKKNAVGIITTDDLLFQFAQMLKEKESNEAVKWADIDILTTAGALFKKMSDIGI